MTEINSIKIDVANKITNVEEGDSYSYDEMQSILGAKYSSSDIESIDTDGDGEISFDELSELEQANIADGVIDADDIKAWIKENGLSAQEKIEAKFDELMDKYLLHPDEETDTTETMTDPAIQYHPTTDPGETMTDPTIQYHPTTDPGETMTDPDIQIHPIAPTIPRDYEDTSAGEEIDKLKALIGNGRMINARELTDAINAGVGDLDGHAASSEYRDFKNFVKDYGPYLSDSAKEVFNQYKQVANNSTGAGIPQSKYNAMINKMDEIADDETSVVNVPDGKLTITGTSDDDVIDVTQEGDLLRVTINGETTYYSGVDSVDIDAGDGDDQININQLYRYDDVNNDSSSSDSMYYQPNNIVFNNINTGSGDDNVMIGDATVRNINTGAGDDLVGVNGGDVRNIDTGAGDDTVENFGTVRSINTGNGDDTVTNYGTIRDLNMGSGDDYINNYGEIRNADGGAGEDTIMNNGGTVRNSLNIEIEGITCIDEPYLEDEVPTEDPVISVYEEIELPKKKESLSNL